MAEENQKMHYVIGDIHNEVKKLDHILNQIQPGCDDEVIVLGDVFDRGGDEADPAGVYFTLKKLQGNCIWIRGNHDQWFADYIEDYFRGSKRTRLKMGLYSYNSFELLKTRMTETDMLNLADWIHHLPLQKEIVIDGKRFLMAHAMTSYPSLQEAKEYYLMGNWELDTFFLEGTEGYISLCGHTPTENILWKKEGSYLDEERHSIWRNNKGNVYLLDCGCGFAGGKLACICIETGERFYSDG